MNYINTKTYVIILLLLLGCQSGSNTDYVPPTNEKEKQQKETMMEVNKRLVKKDSEIIESYVERVGWNMTETKTGLWYQIYEEGQGQKAKAGLNASIAYTVHLLDGTLCYKVNKENPKTFKIGQGGVEAGLEEGILMLREGSKARFIMPPHLAHGLLGDENKIPSRAIIIYDVTLLSLSEK